MKSVRPLLSLTLLALSILPLMGDAKAACDRPVDPQRAVIFLGLNEAFFERKAAEEAACLRGESFYSLPKSLPGEKVAEDAFSEMSRLTLQLESLDAKISRRGCTEGKYAPATPCGILQYRREEMLSARTSAELIYTHYWTALMNDVRGTEIVDAFEKLLIELAGKKIRPTSIILSGHSGGNGVWGYLGTIDFAGVQNSVRSAYYRNEMLLSDLAQVLLWGCNTINPFDGGSRWVKTLPALKMIFGFQGSAPSSKNPASPLLLKSVLLSARSLDAVLNRKGPEAAIKELFDSLRGIENTIGSTYLNDTARSRAYYYERTAPETPVNDERLSDIWTSSVKPVLSEAQCEFMRPELEADQEIARQAFEGKIEISRDTSNGILRDLYTRARRNEACRRTLGLKIEADQFGYLLFWNNVKRNAARLVGTNTAKLLKEIQSYLNGDTRLEAARIAALKQGASAKANAIANYWSSIAETRKKIELLAATYQAFQTASESMPWRKKNERQLKRLAKRILKLPQGNPERESLQATYLVQSEMKAISGPGFSDSLKRIVDGLTSEKEKAILSIATLEESIKRAESESAHVGTTESYRAAIQDVLNAMPPITANGVDLLGYAELADKISQASKKTAYARTQIGTISGLSDLRETLDKMDGALNFYKDLAVNLKTGCLDFQTWHDYSEGATVTEMPRSICDPTLRFLLVAPPPYIY